MNGIELKLDPKTQESILVGAGNAMSTSGRLQFNAMRREGDDIVLYWDEVRNGRRERSLADRLRIWLHWGPA